MKFVVQRDQLISSVQDVMKAISAKAAIPILTGMKIKAESDGITLTGSDSDISIESFIPAEEDGMINAEQIEAGSIVVQARYFPDIVRKLPEKTVEIEADASLKVTIRSGKAKFNLNGQDADEYPKLPALQTDDNFEIQADLLKNLIKQTGFAVSSMETRPILTGVNVKMDEETLHFTATDSHRLASRQVSIEDMHAAFSSIVIPGKSLNELYKILDDNDQRVEISVANNQILFRTKHLNFLSRLLDGNYPETSRLIPEKSQTRLHLKTKELIDTIDRASLLARDERNNVVKLTTKDTETLQISSNSPEVGQVAEEVSLQSMEGEDVKISFSSKYMLDALKAIENDDVIIEFTGAMRPFIIKPINGDPILQLILPVRTY
ncbi:DNA polymerase III subunit beta [Lentibacillus halophilus]|uniref:Beta sliding clamp n=1 Tax=Lentibacillus halophilus TaxID=295065 RepID=A0ABN0Z7F8_9BACI